MPQTQNPAPPSLTRGRWRWGAVLGALAVAAAAVAVGGSLGTWQWDRARAQAEPVEPDPRAPIAEVMVPGEPGRGEGRLVSVEGTYADEDAALVLGREVDGVDAVLLLRPVRVPADTAGADADATLVVLSGWLPADAEWPVPSTGGPATITGYVRGGDGASPDPAADVPPGAVAVGALSTARLAQEWPAPLYSYLVVADEPAPGWNPMPPPPLETQWDIRSLTYAAEWWIFGLFAAVLALRWLRDNGRAPVTQEES